MAKSLLDTVKAVAAPWVEMYAERIEDTVDGLSSLTWVPVSDRPARSPGAAELVFVGREAYYLYVNRRGELKAFENRCSRCGELLTNIADAKKVKCFTCGAEWDVLREEGTLKPREVLVKVENGRLYLGVKAHEP
ncbi:hypothetical protein AB1399_09325 [Hydrogenibacillus schlegelii]|uniref:hypothetical protein n=1 Tax=Hydrogenibacillus schlegelii TaxID=1484 RepID=UPI00349FF1D7